MFNRKESFLLLFIIAVLEIIIIDVHAIYEGQVAGRIIPFMAYIEYKQTYRCGSVILDTTHVITVAQCVIKHSRKSDYKVVGRTLLLGNRYGVRSDVTHAWVNKGYHVADDGMPHNDIAILTINPPFQFNEKIHSIPLAPPKRLVYSNFPCQLFGWGRGSPHQFTFHNREMKYLDLSIGDQNVCKRIASQKWDLSEEHLCIEHDLNRPAGASAGDIGSALICHSHLTALVTVPTVDVLPELPDIYTKVGMYHEFFKQVKIQEAHITKMEAQHTPCQQPQHIEHRCTPEQYYCIMDEYFSAVQARWERNRNNAGSDSQQIPHEPQPSTSRDLNQDHSDSVAKRPRIGSPKSLTKAKRFCVEPNDVFANSDGNILVKPDSYTSVARLRGLPEDIMPDVRCQNKGDEDDDFMNYILYERTPSRSPPPIPSDDSSDSQELQPPVSKL